MMEYLLTKAFKARSAIEAHRICQLVDNEAQAAETASSRSPPIGVSAEIDVAAGALWTCMSPASPW